MGSNDFSETILARKRHTRGKSTGFVSRGTEHVRAEGGKILQWLRPNCCTRLPRTLSDGLSRSPSEHSRHPRSQSGCVSMKRPNCLPCCGTPVKRSVVSPARKRRNSRISAAAAKLRPSCWRALDNEVWDVPDPWSRDFGDSPERIRIANRFLHGAREGAADTKCSPFKDTISSPFKDIVPSPGSEGERSIPIGMIEETPSSVLDSHVTLPKSKLVFDEKPSCCTTEVASNGDDIADDMSDSGPVDVESDIACIPNRKQEKDSQDFMESIHPKINEPMDQDTRPTADQLEKESKNVVDVTDSKSNEGEEQDVQPTTDKPRSRPKARPPGRPPPPGKARPPGKPAGGNPASLPKWCGPVPSPEWKADRVVNWQPIRQAGKWEGSVWQVVNDRMQEGFTPLPDNLLNVAFMKRVDEVVPPRRSTSRTLSARASSRRLSQKAALTADLLYAQLVRKGVEDVNRLTWVTGVSKEETSENPACVELGEEVLECLLGLLRAASGEEGRLLNWEEDASLVPAEAFLQSLVKDVGPLKVLDEHVHMALQIARFPGELASLEQGLKLGIKTVQEVTSSSSIPTLLEGVLLLGNYVNANSKSLSGAVGVTLDSLVKLAHTRCIQGKTPDGSRKQNGSTGRKDNALLLLVEHLQESRPGFLAALSRDLDGCKSARDLDPKTMDETMLTLKGQINKIKARLEAQRSDTAQEQESKRREPTALKASRLTLFLSEWEPRLLAVDQAMKDFRESTLALRQWFAESNDAGFVDVMRNLATLREALPTLKPQPLPPCPRPCRLRQVRQDSKRERPKSMPPVSSQDRIDERALRRSNSEPPLGRFRKTSMQADVALLLKRRTKPLVPKAPPKTRSLEVVVQPVPDVSQKVTQKEIVTPPRRLRALQEMPFSAPKHRATLEICSSVQESDDVSKAQEYIKNMSAKLDASRAVKNSINESKVQVASPMTLNVPHAGAVSRNGPGTKIDVSKRNSDFTALSLTSCSTASEVRAACLVATDVC